MVKLQHKSASGSKKKRKLLKRTPKGCPQPILSKDSLRGWFALVGKIVGIAVPALTAWQIYSALTPEVSSTHADNVDPFSAPFEISNQSELFELYGVEPMCGISSLTLANGSGMRNMTLSVGVEEANIAPRRTARYFCPLDPQHLNLNIQSDPLRNADIVIYGVYQLGLFGHVFAHRFGFRSDLLHWQVGADGTPYWTTGLSVE
jgi:hypothetical protein